MQSLAATSPLCPPPAGWGRSTGAKKRDQAAFMASRLRGNDAKETVERKRIRCEYDRHCPSAFPHRRSAGADRASDGGRCRSACPSRLSVARRDALGGGRFPGASAGAIDRNRYAKAQSEEHTSELQS